MTFDHLYYFITICKYDNLTRAAEEINISQPALSNCIKQLESEFGVPLFHRTNKGLVLTSAGKIFQEEATAILDRVDYLKKRMGEYVSLKSTVNVAVAPLISTIIFPQVFHEFRNVYPDITINLREAGSKTNLEAVIKGDRDVDLAIVSSDPTAFTVNPDACNRVSLCTVPLVCYMSADHPLAKEPYIDFPMIANEPLIMLPDDTFISRNLHETFALHNIQPNVILTTRQLSMIHNLIVNNTALTFLYKGSFPTSTAIKSVPFKNPIDIGIDIVWNKEKKVLKSTRKFIDFVESYPFD